MSHEPDVLPAPWPRAEELAAWAEAAGCRLLVLFGSSATPTSAPPKDVDLATSFREIPSPGRRLSLIGELQDRCGLRRADVDFLHRGTDPVLRSEIFRGGGPLYEEQPGSFVEEAVRALFL